MEDSKRLSRRRHAAEMKRQVLAACAEPGGPVAQVALAHGLNANLVHRWQRTVDARGVDSKSGNQQAEFVSLRMTPDLAVASDIHLEIRRGAIAVRWHARHGFDEIGRRKHSQTSQYRSRPEKPTRPRPLRRTLRKPV